MFTPLECVVVSRRARGADLVSAFLFVIPWTANLATLLESILLCLVVQGVPIVSVLYHPIVAFRWCRSVGALLALVNMSAR